MQTWPEEPEVTDWQPVDDATLAGRLGALIPTSGAALVLIDGRSGNGKSTLGDRICRLIGAGLIHTDDVAWHLHATDWADALVGGVLEPWRRGDAVSFRPPGWVARDRPGSIELAPTRILVVEGVGAGRAELARQADVVIWVQSDQAEARRRGVVRDVALGRPPTEAEAFWDEWASSEDPFLAADRPWTRADFIVNGTPPRADDRTWLAPGPIGTATGPLDPPNEPIGTSPVA